MNGGSMKKYQRHHTNFYRPQYDHYDDKHPVKQVRHHPAMIIPALPLNHRLLHHMMKKEDQTPIPDIRVAQDLLNYMPSRHNVPNRSLAFVDAANFLLQQARTHHSSEYARSASDLGSHYVRQLGFLSMQEEAAQLMLLDIVLDQEAA